MTSLLPNLGPINKIIKSVGWRWAKSQSHSIADQLTKGIRYIDLRVYVDSNGIYLVHSFEAGLLYDELAGIVDFVNTHENEVIILDMNHIYMCDNATLRTILEHFYESFKEKLCPPAAPGKELPTYGDLISKKTKVIVAISKDLQKGSSYNYNDVKNEFEWVWASRTNIVSPYKGTTDTTKLKQFLENEMKNVRSSNALYITQTVQAPTTSTVFSGLFKRPKNLEQLSERLKPLLPTWFNEFTQYRLNIAIMDFPDSDLIENLINFNIPASDE